MWVPKTVEVFLSTWERVGGWEFVEFLPDQGGSSLRRVLFRDGLTTNIHFVREVMK